MGDSLQPKNGQHHKKQTDSNKQSHFLGVNLFESVSFMRRTQGYFAVAGFIFLRTL